MHLKEIILQTRQAVQAAVRSHWSLVEEFPPVTEFEFTQDIKLQVLDNVLSEQIMDCCDPSLLGLPKPVRQSPELYSFVRDTTDYKNLWDWTPDRRLETCVALSRLIHPTSFPFDYHVKVSIDDNGKLIELIPLAGPLRSAWIAERDRDWLTENDCVDLKKLVCRLPLTFSGRLNRAFWYNEYAARTYFADLRWTLVATALEALVHTEKANSTRQFVDRSSRLAVAVGLEKYTRVEASQFYDLRSSLAHGQGLGTGDLSPDDQALYVLAEDLLRLVLKRAILEPEFAAAFANNTSVRATWST